MVSENPLHDFGTIANTTVEKQRDADNLTPLDARNSLMLIRAPTDKSFLSVSSVDLKEKTAGRGPSPDRYYPQISDYGMQRRESPPKPDYRDLTGNDDYGHARSSSGRDRHQPTANNTPADYGYFGHRRDNSSHTRF